MIKYATTGCDRNCGTFNLSGGFVADFDGFINSFSHFSLDKTALTVKITRPYFQECTGRK